MKRTPRRDRKQASRERILDAASRAMRRAGFDGVAVAEVMKEAGLTHGGFYAHFDSRDALLAAAVARAGCSTADALQEHITRLTRAGVSPFRALLETYLYDGSIVNRENGCAVAALCAEVPRQGPGIADTFLGLIHGLHRRVAQALPAGLPDGTAWAATSTLVGALQLARALGNNEEGRAVLAAAKRDLLARYEP
jgi:AcrR family transcriptional regulator